VAEIQPFRVNIPQSALDDVANRLRNTRWMEDVVRGDPRYGASVPFVKSLCDRWLNGFDWRTLEARINTHPNVLVDVDGLNIHAIHQTSSRADAIPLILLHGWPSSILEFLDIIPSLVEPPAGEPAFHVVIASLPGNSWSTIRPDITVPHTARLMAGLMEKLGYDRFMIQGGNWGSPIGVEIARQFPGRVIGLHLNSINGSPPPEGSSLELTDDEERWIGRGKAAAPHFVALSQQPFTISQAFNDSPAGLAAWVGEKLRDWADNRHGPGVSLDWMVGTIALFWFTGTIGSSSLLYFEHVHHGWEERYVSVPTAMVVFSEEFVRIPRSWAARHHNIVRWTLVDRGGHFPATEVPDLFAADLRAFASQIS
jgi:microsomal epoxide hydrolase